MHFGKLQLKIQDGEHEKQILNILKFHSILNKKFKNLLFSPVFLFLKMAQLA